MKYIFCIACLLAITYSINAQSSNRDSLNRDSLKIIILGSADSNIVQDNRVNELMLKHILLNEAKKSKIKGYRVQIHFGVEKAKANEVKSNFLMVYNDVPAYLDYQQPYFKIRVGDFRTRLEAYKFHQEIAEEFIGSFIVADEIELPKIE
ncbi:MAG: SPOR domain-containing protein [Bacteroidota bacterium]